MIGKGTPSIQSNIPRPILCPPWSVTLLERAPSLRFLRNDARIRAAAVSLTATECVSGLSYDAFAQVQWDAGAAALPS
jgi:hypothetical protein